VRFSKVTLLLRRQRLRLRRTRRRHALQRHARTGQGTTMLVEITTITDSVPKKEKEVTTIAASKES
jgi:hypothetical protein